MKTIQKYNFTMVLLLLVMIQTMTLAHAQTPIGAEFTYQGELTFNEQAAEGLYDFEISAYDALENGNQTGSPLTVNAVEVNNGIFTLSLDFGDAAFVGNEVYLEINVRENNSGQPFNLLTPRQKLTNTPYAIHAQFVGADAVSGAEILNGSITSQDLSNNSITATKIVDNAVGTEAIDSSEVQRRVNGDCSVGSYVRGINEDGTVTCQTDETGNSQVTSADIVDGTIIAADIENGTIGATEVNSAEIQTRVSSTCEEGLYLNGINQDGTVQCARLPSGLDFTMESPDEIGEYNSIAIGADNNPIISYWNRTDNSLEVIKCTNPYCSSQNPPVTLDNSGNVGATTSIAIGVDDNPVISYYDFINQNLMLVKCTSQDCSSQNAPLTMDNGGIVGNYNSIAVGLDGFPVISYYDLSNKDLKLVKCTSQDCSSFNTPLTLDSDDKVGIHTSIAIGLEGYPVMSYVDFTNASLKLIKCTSQDCSSINAPLTLSSGSVYQSDPTSIAIASNGNPYIVFYNSGIPNLRLVRCSNPACSNSFIINIPDTDNVGFSTSMAIGADDLPVISFYNSQTDDLKFVKCSAYSCNYFSALKTLDTVGNVGRYNSIAIGADNNPIISYLDLDNFALKIYSCADTECNR